VVQIAHEEDKGKNRATDERVGEDLAEDVSGEDAHG
jgi:hypothetical protein